MPRVNLSKLKVAAQSRRSSVGANLKSGCQSHNISQASISSFFSPKDCTDSESLRPKKRPAVIVLDDSSTDSQDISKESKRQKLFSKQNAESMTERGHEISISTATFTRLKNFEKDTGVESTVRSEKGQERLQDLETDTVTLMETAEMETKKTDEECMIIGGPSKSLNVDMGQFLRRTTSEIHGSVCNSKDQSSKCTEKTVNHRTKSPYTPLELQFMEIKSKYKDAVLFVECGYKFKFFGEDAEVASKELNIMCFMDHNFMVASIPLHRLHVHVQRLVGKGYKVGVVKQTETAALKAAGDNKGRVFTRELHALYTKSTLVGEDMKTLTCSNSDGVDEGETTDTGCGAYLMCICEDDTSTNDNRSLSKSSISGITYGIVAVQPATGDIIFDEFQDAPGCSELETRIEHIGPAEILIPIVLSPQTQGFIQDFTSHATRPEEVIRVEQMSSECDFTQDAALKIIRDFCDNNDNNTSYSVMNSPGSVGTNHGSTQDNSLLQMILNLPKTTQICFAALVSYLKDFKLDKVMKLKSNFVKFSTSARYMKLNGSTLRNLEILKNQSGGERGSLFWVLNHTSTSFGKRLLRKWISQPLQDTGEIQSRLESVSELCSSNVTCIQKLQRLLFQLPDLERGLCSIFYKKCSPSEFLTMVTALNKLAIELNAAKEIAVREVSSPMLVKTFVEVPELLQGTDKFLQMIDEKAAKNGDKTKLFTDHTQFPEVVKSKQEIRRITDELKNHRSSIRQVIQHPSIDYCTVAGNEFLIEVRNAKLPSVPASWIKISSTKQLCRFRTPFVEEQYKLLCQQRETLALVCHRAWLEFLDMFCTRYARYHKAVQRFAVTDCLLSLATVAKQPGFVRPVIKEGTGSSIRIKQGRHPIIDTLLAEHEQYVPNDTSMQMDDIRCMIITGPNMGGKSSYIKQVALIAIMAQIGSYVPALEAELTPIDAIYTRMGASDSIYKGRSTFMVELQEASEILEQATSRSLVILDELGRGTSTHDGMAIAFATLHHFVTQARSLTLFVTHYPSLADLQKNFPDNVTNNHMAFMTSDDDVTGDSDACDSALDEGPKAVAMGTPSVIFLYQLVKGVAARSYGVNVARLAGVPPEILTVAARKSSELEVEITSKRSVKTSFEEIWRAPKGNIVYQIRKLKTLQKTS